MVMLVRNNFTEMFLNLSFGVENFVGENYGQSKEGAFIFFVQLHLELLSKEHTQWLSQYKMIYLKCLYMSALLLKILLERIMGNQKKLRLFSLSSYV